MALDRDPGVLCLCGCGAAAPIAAETDPRSGAVQGRALRFVHGHNRRKHRLAESYRVEDRGFETPCWIWAGVMKGSYPEVRHGGRYCMAHRAMYEEIIGPIPAGTELDHRCRQRACVRPDHLEPVSSAENIRRGAATKLTREGVISIRRSLRRGRDLAREFGVSEQTICDIRKGRTWIQIDEELAIEEAALSLV